MGVGDGRRVGGCLAHDAEVVHVHGQAVGTDEFSGQIGVMRVGLAGLTGRLSGELQSVQGWDHQPWELVDDSGATFASGRYVARRAVDSTFDVLLSLPDAHA